MEPPKPGNKTTLKDYILYFFFILVIGDITGTGAIGLNLLKQEGGNLEAFKEGEFQQFSDSIRSRLDLLESPRADGSE